jgi:nucleoside-diphosphate-sugar epimerase
LKVLVTGATGFIGGRIAEHLLARGDQVVALTRNPQRGERLAAAGATVVVGDLSDADALARAVAGCDAVIHCAGVPRPASWKVFRRVHVEGTHHLIEAAQAAGVRRFVNVASQSVIYAGQHVREADETTPYPEHFIDPYSETKALGEQVALAANREGGFEVTSVRPAVTWGRGDSTILPIMARLATSPMGVPAAGHGRNLEASTHIDNVAHGTLAALDSATAPGRCYFLLDDFEVGWREFLARQLEAAGVRPKFLGVPVGVAGPLALTLDRVAGALGLTVPMAYFGMRMAVTDKHYATTRARDELGYRPRMGFEEGLADLAQWVEELGGAKALMALARSPEKRG